jgi:hypothetical protein
MSIDRLDFGIFLAPFHPVRENPTLSLRRDFELIERLGATSSRTSRPPGQ